jgi:hypothetical protein
MSRNAVARPRNREFRSWRMPTLCAPVDLAVEVFERCRAVHHDFTQSRIAHVCQHIENGAFHENKELGCLGLGWPVVERRCA